MFHHKYTLRDLLNDLYQRKIIDKEGFKNIINYISKKPELSPTPWYIKILIAMGAWLAGLFFILFLAISEMIDFDSTGILLIWGIIFIGAAMGLYHFWKTIFAAQLALALSVAGHALVLTSIEMDSDGIAGIFPAALVLCILLYPLYKYSLHRFLSCTLAIGAGLIFIFDKEIHHWLHVLLFLQVIGIGFLLQNQRFINTLRPLFYSLVITIPIQLIWILIPESEIHTPFWPSNIILTLALLGLFYWILKESNIILNNKEPILLSCLVTVLLGVLSTPGILAAVGVLILAFHLQDKPLTGIGLFFLPVFIIQFYYSLNMTLDIKSVIMIGSGLVLLGLRWYLKKRPWIKGEYQ